MTILTLIFISYFSAYERELTQATVKNDNLSSLERNKSFVALRRIEVFYVQRTNFPRRRPMTSDSSWRYLGAKRMVMNQAKITSRGDERA